MNYIQAIRRHLPGISPERIEILLAVDLDPGASIRDIAEKVNLNERITGHHVREMSSLIAIGRRLDDQRTADLRLTEKAQQLIGLLEWLTAELTPQLAESLPSKAIKQNPNQLSLFN